MKTTATKKDYLEPVGETYRISLDDLKKEADLQFKKILGRIPKYDFEGTFNMPNGIFINLDDFTNDEKQKLTSLVLENNKNKLGTFDGIIGMAENLVPFLVRRIFGFKDEYIKIRRLFEHPDIEIFRVLEP